MGKEVKSGTYREKLLDPRWRNKMMAVCYRFDWKFSAVWEVIIADVLAAVNAVKGYDFDRLAECIGKARMADGEQEIDTEGDVG